MKQQKLVGYQPKYPRKALRSAALTAAALVAMTGAGGCREKLLPELQTTGLVPMETPREEELILDGEVGIPEPGEEELILDGEVGICEPTEGPALEGKIAVTEPPEEELILDGDVAIPEPQVTPTPQDVSEDSLRTTGVLLMATDTPQS